MRTILMILLSFGICGCGTVLNLVDYDDPGGGMYTQQKVTAPRDIYGGTVIDGVSGAEWMNQGNTLLGLYVWCVDLPLSVAADTLTLPLTIASSVGNPLPGPRRATASLGSLGKNLKEKSHGLIDSLPSWGEESDSAVNE